MSLSRARKSTGNALALAAALPLFAPLAEAAAMQVTSPVFKESGLLAAEFSGGVVLKSGAAAPTDCGGGNISPPLAWTNVPAGTKSFGLIVYDPDGAKGNGAVHWVAYSIDGARRGIPQGFGDKPSADFTGGTGTAGNHTYNGPCPVPGHINHYVFTIYALDLARGALPPGLTRDQFFAATRGHVLDIGSIVARAPSRQRAGPGTPAPR